MNIFKRFRVQDTVSDVDVEVGIKMYVLDGICFVATTMLQGGVYLSAYALYIGASQKQIGIIASIGFICQFMQLVGLYILTKYENRKFITVFVAFLSRILWIPVIILAFFNFKEINTFLIIFFCSFNSWSCCRTGLQFDA